MGMPTMIANLSPSVVGMEIPVDPNIMDGLHNVQPQHLNPQALQRLAPVAQMHMGHLGGRQPMFADGTNLVTGLDHPNHHGSSEHSAEIARAALTQEEDGGLREQLENINRGNEAVPMNVGVPVRLGMGVGSVNVGGVGLGVGQSDMEIDSQEVLQSFDHQAL